MSSDRNHFRNDELFETFKAKIKTSDVYNEKNLFVIFGASGDLAKKEIYPNLWRLYKNDLLPEKISILGYARSKIKIEEYLRFNVFQDLELKIDDQIVFEDFLNRNEYLSGSYDKEESFEQLNEKLVELSKKFNESDQSFDCNRIFYLAVPPSQYKSICELISRFCRPGKIILEKPFGKDLDSSNELQAHISNLFVEEEIYRMDHYLGKEMVQNLIVLRFANQIFKRIWNRDSIEHVIITFKEPFGIEGRGGYFDEYGIIRDIIQNHILQILTLVAMEQPVSNSADEIRNEKVKVLRSIPEIGIDDIVIGQYIGNEEGTEQQKVGYKDEESVPKNSNASTFSTIVLKVKNDRWDGVPFVIICGKALDEVKAEVKLKFREVPGDIFENSCKRNELVIRIQPNQGIYMKINTKNPSLNFTLEDTELDLTYKKRYQGIYMPGAYERLIIDVFLGNQAHFVRSDELAEAWRIFTPILHKIENEKIKPIPYKFGSASITEADELLNRVTKMNVSKESHLLIFRNDNY